MPSDTATVALPRPAEKVAIVSLVLVFLCGAALGAVAMSLRRGSHPVHPAFTMSVSELQQKLDLTPEQTIQLTSILDDFSHYYDNVLADGNSRINQILNPEQQLKFKKTLGEHKR